MAPDVTANFVTRGNDILKDNMKKRLGFTLIEVLLTVVIVGVGLFGLMTLYHNASRKVMEGDVNMAATYLVRERLEQIIADKVSQGYGYVINDNYTTSAAVTVGNHMFTRSFNIYEVNASDLITPEIGTGHKRIDMTLTWGTGAGQSITTPTLVTNY